MAREYSLSPEVVFTRFEADGDGVLLNLKTKNYYTLNETAAFIWTHLEAGGDVDSISEALTENFHVTIDVARASIEDLLSELEEEGLMTRD